MKQMIRKRLSIVILTTMLLTLVLNYFLQIQNARGRMYQDALDKFRQVEQILEENETDMEQLKSELKRDCFMRAKAAAYIVQNQPDVTGSQDEMEKIAKLLQVDEFHLFDTEGTLYAGSQPRYFGLNFNSGDQMRFFLPMLEDVTLEMCQDITPNTAEQKLMQYAAVWREDGKGIVQIGLEPVRVLDAMKKNELSYIFSMVTAENGSIILAADPETRRILGSTDEKLVGQDVEASGLDWEKIVSSEKGFRANVNGEDSYCVFTPSSSVILGIVRADEAMYRDVNRITLMVAMYLLLISLIMIAFISNYIDKYIVDGISSINSKLIKITNGNLDTEVEVKGAPEFMELSSQVNLMVRSILDSTNKLSWILEIAEVPIGVYEYNGDMKRVMATSRVADILMLPKEETKKLLSDCGLFEKKLDEIRQNPVRQEMDVYRLSGEHERFVRLESFAREHSILGMIIDVTGDVKERQRIKQERDMDLLTGLLSRRAFYRCMEELFTDPKALGTAVMFMADSDNLKGVNDQYGHQCGDQYLKEIAGILKSCGAANQVPARLGGDEFILFLYGGTDRNELQGYIDDIYKVMAGAIMAIGSDGRIPVSFSGGCAWFPEDGEDFHELLKKADNAMYEVKKARKVSDRDRE